MTYLDLNPCYLRLLRVDSCYTLFLPTTPHSHPHIHMHILHIHILQVISNPPVPTLRVLMTVLPTHTEPSAPHTQHTQHTHHTSQAHYLKFQLEEKLLQFWNAWCKVWISANGFYLHLQAQPRSHEVVPAAR